MLKLSATLLDDLHNTEIPKLVAVLWFSAILMILFSVGISSGQAALAKTPSASLPLPGTEPASPPSAPKAHTTTPTETTVHPGESIEAAIQTLPEEGGTILLVSGETYVQNSIDITKTVTIKTTGAEKATIDGDGGEIFLVDGYGVEPIPIFVSFQNLHLTNAWTDLNAACLNIANVDTDAAGEGGFEVIDCDFTNCEGETAGAGHIARSSGTISGSTFISNTSVNAGAGLTLLNSNVDVTGSLFRNNVSEILGGGIYIDPVRADNTVFLDNLDIISNQSKYYGAGIYYSDVMTGQGFIVDSTVVSNTITADSDYGQAGEDQDVLLYDSHVYSSGTQIGNDYLHPPSSWIENSPPLAQPDAVTTTVDQSVVIPVLDNDQDPDGDSLSISDFIRPENGTVVGHEEGLIYYPDSGYVGTDTFSYQITDGHYESEPATVTVTVEAENQAPVAMTDTVTTAAETSVVVDVLANDTDPEGEALTVTQVSSPTHGTATILADQTIEYTPPPDFNGADQFTYTVSDGEATAQGAVSVTVEAVNDAPIAHADAVTTTAETPVVITPLDNDHDPDGDPLTLTAVGAPAHGQATLHPTTATITYTPTQDLDTVTLPYTDPFSYTISDGAHIVSGTISVTVTASQRTIFLPLVSRE